MASASSPSANLLPGDTLEQYEILEQIGAGGTSIVWKARDPLLDRLVAIKQLNLQDTDDDALRQRFADEADLMRQLGESHPRLVRFITLIDEPRGLFIVMEHVQGPSLEQVLSRSDQPMAPLTALRIIRTLGIVLDAIHQQQILHRDLKPSNILLPKAGLKLCDLGIATALADQQAMTVGSVRYMAPELLRNEPGDGRSDLYALGMVAYEMLAGRQAFAQVFKSVLRDPRNQAMRWMKWHTNPRLTAPRLEEINPQVPTRLSELVARLMAKDPAKRIASARQLVEAIDHHFTQTDAPSPPLAKTKSDTPPPSTDTPDTATLPKRKKWPIAAAITLTLLMLAGGGWWARHALQQRVLARVQQNLASEQLDAASKAYLQGDFDQAAADYAQAIALLNDPVLLRDAQEKHQLATIQVNLHAGRFDAARQQLDNLDATGQLPRDTLRNLMRELEQRQRFARDITQAQDDLSRGDIGQARHRLGLWRQAVLSPQEQARWSSLQVQLQGAIAQREIDAAIAHAQALYADGQVDQAIDWLTQTNQQQFNSAQLQAVVDQWVRLRTHLQQVQQGRAAEADGDLENAILAYQAAILTQPDETLTQHILQLQSDTALAQGQQLLRAGDQAGALASFTRALGYADTAQARGWLARIETRQQRAALLAAGDRAMALQDFTSAQNQYRAAAQLDDTPDAQLAQKINRARVQQLMLQATTSLDANHYERARSQLQQVRAIAPHTPGIQQGLNLIDLRLRYREHVDAGDQLRKQSKFADAKARYRQAQQLIADDAIAQRLDAVEYEHLLAQGRAYLATRQWASAKAVLLSAADLENTPTVQRLLAQANAETADE